MGEIINLKDDRIIYMEFRNIQEDTLIDLFCKEFREVYYPYIEKPREQPPTLVDCTNFSLSNLLSSDQRKKIADVMKPTAHIPSKIALLNLNTFIQIFLSAAFRVAGLKDDIKYFASKDQAITWLKS